MSTLNTPAFSGGAGADMLSFELLASNVSANEINSSNPVTVTLPTLPRNFRAEKMFLTLYEFDQWWGTPFELSFRLHDRNFNDQLNTTVYLSNGVAEIPVNMMLPAQYVNQSTFYFNSAGSVYGEYGYGLVLWVRGAWIN